MQKKKALFPPPLTMATGNLKKTSGMSPIKDNSQIATRNKTFNNFGKKMKKIGIQIFHGRSSFAHFRKSVSNIF